MESALRALLVGHGPLTALVAQRVYWNAIPQGTLDPAVVLYKITGATGITHEGPDGLEAATVQIDVRAVSVTSMWAVRDAIIAKLHGHKDSTFRGIILRSERQSSEKPDTTLYHRASLDFDLWAAAA